MADNGNFVVAWEEDSDSNGFYQASMRGLTITGAQRFAETAANTVATGQQYAPSVGVVSTPRSSPCKCLALAPPGRVV